MKRFIATAASIAFVVARSQALLAKMVVRREI